MDPRIRLGQAFLDLGREEEFSDWLRNLPATPDRHPGAWNLRGQWAEDEKQVEAAARCYWEALRLEPSDSLACYRLGVSLRGLGREAEGEKLLDRSDQQVLLIEGRSVLMPQFP